MQRVDEVEHEYPELGSGKAGTGGDAPGRHNESGVHTIDPDGSGKSVGSEAEPEDGDGVTFDFRRLGKHPMWHSFAGFD